MEKTMTPKRSIAIALFTIALCAGVANAQTVTLTADVTQADGRATPTLSWSTTPIADDCVASGDWSGSKGPSGTELQPETTTSVVYSLTCSWDGFGEANLTWTAPQFNVDGTLVTDLTSYDLYWGAASGNYTNSVEIADPLATSYTVENLAAGTYYFVITATNSIDVESDFSNEATRTIDAVQAVESVAVSVNPQIDVSDVNLQAN